MRPWRRRTGRYEFKFLVNGQFVCDGSLPVERVSQPPTHRGNHKGHNTHTASLSRLYDQDEFGNVNNVIEIRTLTPKFGEAKERTSQLTRSTHRPSVLVCLCLPIQSTVVRSLATLRAPRASSAATAPTTTRAAHPAARATRRATPTTSRRPHPALTPSPAPAAPPPPRVASAPALKRSRAPAPPHRHRRPHTHDRRLRWSRSHQHHRRHRTTVRPRR